LGRGAGSTAPAGRADAGTSGAAFIEGPRMMTNIVGCDIDALQIGDPVEVVFHDTGQGAARPRFRPAGR
jgi:hypothetical protein